MVVWETSPTCYLWQSQWYDLRQDPIHTQTGHEFTHMFIDHPGAVWVVPVAISEQVAVI